MFNFFKKKVITRFAPSPTGELHIGGARTALFAYLFAKGRGGKFLLRIEDTDRERYVEGAIGRIIESLDWLGIKPDNRGNVMLQSRRLEIYKKYARLLLEKGNAYICVCSKEKLAAVREKQIQEKKPPRYEGSCRELNLRPENVEGKEYVIRMKMPKGGSISVNDVIRGKVVFDLSLFDDQILLKSDGYPTYHLASVIDDHEMNITHILRAEEWLSSTPKHLILYGMFGWSVPEFAHLPYVLAPDRSKLSKRHGAVSIAEFKNLGYLPEALVNFIALLGWHLKEDRELLTIGEIIKEFNLNRVQKGGAVFDIKKLNWMNAEYLKAKTPEELLAALVDLYGKSEVIFNDESATLKLLQAGKGRLEKLSDFKQLKESFGPAGDYNPDLLIWKNTPGEEILENLKKSEETAKSFPDREFSRKNLENKIMPIADAIGRGEVLWPLRVALSGKDKSPGPFELMEILGKEETLKRIEIAIQKLELGIKN